MPGSTVFQSRRDSVGKSVVSARRGSNYHGNEDDNGSDAVFTWKECCELWRANVFYHDADVWVKKIITIATLCPFCGNTLIEKQGSMREYHKAKARCVVGKEE